MYNSELIRLPKRCSYEGLQKTTIKTFESSDHGDSVFIERPLGFVQRAYTDVQTNMDAINMEELIAINPAHTVLGIWTETTNRPHRMDVSDYIEFPITNGLSSCTFKPDRAKAGEFYTSEPKEIARLVRYLAGEEWKRTTKMQISEYIVERHTNAFGAGPIIRSDYSDARIMYRWLLYDSPAQNYIVETRAGRHFIPTDEIVLDVGGVFRHIDVFRTGNIFKSENKLIQIPAKYLASRFQVPMNYRGIHFTDGAEEIVHFAYRLSPYSAEIGKDGFAVFEQKPGAGEAFRISMHLEQVLFRTIATGVTYTQTTTTAFWQTFKGAMMQILTDLENVDLIAPAVRFTLLRNDSLHFNGKRFGPSARSDMDDDSFRNQDTQLREACASFETRVNSARAEFSNPVDRADRTYGTFLFDCDASWIGRDIQNKLNTTVTGTSLMDWTRLPFNSQHIISTPVLQVRKNRAVGGFLDDVGAITGAPSQLFRFEQNSLLEHLPYLEGIVLLEDEGNGIVFIAPVNTLAHDGGDTTITINIGENVANVAAATPIFGSPWAAFNVFEIGVCTRHVATSQMVQRFFVPEEYMDLAVNPPINRRTNRVLDDYFVGAQAGNEVNLLVPAAIRLALSLNTVDFGIKLVVHRYESYAMASGNTEVYDFALAVVNIDGVDRHVLRLFDVDTMDYRDVKELAFSYGSTFQFIRVPAVIQHGLNIIGENQDNWPQRTALEDQVEYDCLGDRVVGFKFDAADAVLCGPISPCPQLEIKRPVNNGAIMLPPRLGN